MYGKIFRQIFASSIAQDYKVRHIFMDLLVLAEVDGAIDMTLEAIQGITRVPSDDLKSAIDILLKPDPQSRTPDFGGARLVRLDAHRNWGWRIVNYERYREIANDEERRAAIGRRVKKYRQKLANKPRNAGVTRCNKSHTSTSTCTPAAVQERGTGETPGPTWEQCLSWLKIGQNSGADYTESETRSAFLALSANGWMWGRNQVADWRSALERQIQTDRQHANRNQNNGRAGSKGFDRNAGTLNAGKAKLYSGKAIQA